MHEPLAPLTESQRTRLAMGRDDLERLRSVDVARVGEHELIMHFETARTALDDALRLVGEVVEAAAQPEP